jgi:hypothetical protein
VVEDADKDRVKDNRDNVPAKVRDEAKVKDDKDRVRDDEDKVKDSNKTAENE